MIIDELISMSASGYFGLPLVAAAINNRDDVITLFVTSGVGVDINKRDCFSSTAVWAACSAGYRSTAELLLDRKYYDHPDTSGPDFDTAIYAAITGDNEDLVATFMPKTTYSPDLVLAVAAGYNSTKVAGLVLKDGRANINHHSSDCVTVLAKAARAGHAEMVQLLLSYGADTTIGRRGGPLAQAASNGTYRSRQGFAK